MRQFLTQDSPIPPYMSFPRFLLDKDGLNETAKILYTILLDRARLSQKNDGWADEQGHPKDLARARIYDRVLERCIPLKINNQNIRELNAAANMQAARKILNSGT